MIQLTRLQQFALEHVESVAADTWKKLLDTSICSFNEVDPDGNRARLCNLHHSIHRTRDYLNDLAKELGNYRWAVDLSPSPNTDSVTLTRVFLMPDLNNKCPVDYKGSLYHVATDHQDLMRALEADVAETIEKMAPYIESVGTSKWDKEVKQGYIDECLFHLSTIQATNDYLVNRFGEDDTGIVIYQAPSGKLAVHIYQTDGIREPLAL